MGPPRLAGRCMPRRALTGQTPVPRATWSSGSGQAAARSSRSRSARRSAPVSRRTAARAPTLGRARPRSLRGPRADRVDLELRALVEAERHQLCSRLTRLEAEKVWVKTQSVYLGVLKVLLAGLRPGPLPAWTREEWGATAFEFVEWLFDQGGADATAKRLGSALAWGEPKLSAGTLRLSFPVLQQTLRGWVQQRPELSRPPVPWLAAAAAALWLLEQGLEVAALGAVIMCETYMRPSEQLAIDADHVVPPLEGESVIRAQEGLVPTKTNAFDVSVPLDMSRQRWLARCVEALVRRRGPGERLLEVECVGFQESFRTALSAVGALELRATLCCLRRGGASHDRCVAARTLADVQQGGWCA
ncbi:unnamed protein product [Prorocentrum cordatum]|uniref:Uncharacterized protein n=1 Tax=Prorocentrum cordatum TaxID=2364126 RepID=A0ABN9UTQ1_9DINO|nr:unnamed protein product [Polarella glacialis]